MDIKISGSGIIASGEYENIHVSGSAKANGLIRCKNLHCSGSIKTDGDLRCDGEIKVSGSAKIEKDFYADSVSISGSVASGGSCNVKNKISVSGRIDCNKNIKCNILKVSGGIYAENIEAENVDIGGKINCDGLLNAEEIKIEAEGSSSVGSIGGGKIIITTNNEKRKKMMPLFKSIVGNLSSREFTVKEAIEGDTIAIENVNAKSVSGRIVAIGAGCNISYVRYSETIEISPDASVEKYEKI